MLDPLRAPSCHFFCLTLKPPLKVISVVPERASFDTKFYVTRITCTLFTEMV